MEEFTDKNLDDKINQSKKPLVVDFFAPWCGPCQMMAPIFEEIASEEKNFLFGKINVDENPKSAAKYQILGVPTIIVFKEGKVIKEISGYLGKAELKKFLNSIEV